MPDFDFILEYCTPEELVSLHKVNRLAYRFFSDEKHSLYKQINQKKVQGSLKVFSSDDGLSNFIFTYFRGKPLLLAEGY